MRIGLDIIDSEEVYETAHGFAEKWRRWERCRLACSSMIMCNRSCLMRWIRRQC